MKKTKLFMAALMTVGMLSFVSCGDKDNDEKQSNGGGNGGGSVEIVDGALPGVFSVSETKKVRFSMGNLQYSNNGAHMCADGIEHSGTWSFAANQYDFIGEGNQNISAKYDGIIDLFGWATSGYHDATDHGNLYYFPYCTSTEYNEVENSYGYGPWYSSEWPSDITEDYRNYDWGVFNAISNGGDSPERWRTLTRDEWLYLLNNRAPAFSSSPDSAMFCMATVCNVKGMIIFPDNYVFTSNVPVPAGINQYDGQFSDNEIDEEAWKAMEKTGVVFLPAAGIREGTTLNYLGVAGYYWSTNCYSNHGALALRFYNGYTNTVGYVSNRCQGYSVRLVQDVE